MPIAIPPTPEELRAHPVVNREAWLEARKQHLRNEKALTRMRDMVAAERRRLPWVKVEKEYVFETRDGKKTLPDLFKGRSQLVVHHFMLGPGWEAGCPGCSFAADHAEGALVHLENHDVAFVRVSRAPLAEIEAYNTRMGWKAEWVSSHDSDFNYDYHVSFTPEALASGQVTYNYDSHPVSEGTDQMETPGFSVFYKNEEGSVFHTYSSYARGNEEVAGAFIYFDMTPKGRNEDSIMEWLRRHDEYESRAAERACH